MDNNNYVVMLKGGYGRPVRITQTPEILAGNRFALFDTVVEHGADGRVWQGVEEVCVALSDFLFYAPIQKGAADDNTHTIIFRSGEHLVVDLHENEEPQAWRRYDWVFQRVGDDRFSVCFNTDEVLIIVPIGKPVLPDESEDDEPYVSEDTLRSVMAEVVAD